MKKKRVKKKKTCRRQLVGLLPISQPWSRYNALYCDIGRWGVQQGGHDTARRLCYTANMGHDMTGHARGRAAARARAAWLAGESLYKCCIVDGGDF